MRHGELSHVEMSCLYMTLCSRNKTNPIQNNKQNKSLIGSRKKKKMAYLYKLYICPFFKEEETNLNNNNLPVTNGKQKQQQSFSNNNSYEMKRKKSH